MNIIMSPSHKIVHLDQAGDRHRMVDAAQTCYQYNKELSPEEQMEYIGRLHRMGHSITEHSSVTVKVICDRRVSHQLVRHRAGCSFAQESTRYCNYSKGRFGNEITVVKPVLFAEDSLEFDIWKTSCEASEARYFALLDAGKKPEDASAALPMSLKTTIDITTNLRQWYHILEQRTNRDVHPDTRAVCMGILGDLAEPTAFPEIFKDLYDERWKIYFEDIVSTVFGGAVERN